MSRQTRIWTLLFVGGAVWWGALGGLHVWRTRAEADTAPRIVVHFDRETNERFVIEAGKVPAAHPVTGRNTLYPGLYCMECQDWVPAPDADVVQRGGQMRCPDGHTDLSISGPAVVAEVAATAE